jgi:Fe-S-cluster containining protein
MSPDPQTDPPSEFALMSVALTTPSGVLRGKVSVDTGPMRLAELVPTAYELTNVLVAQAAQREQKEGRRVSCRAGCGTCCRQMVAISPPEAFYLMDMLDSLEPASRVGVMQRIEHIVSELERQQMIDELMNPEYSDDAILPIARKYFLLGMPCPFLVDESCSIHPHRPVVCREYNVTSRAELCVDPVVNDITKVPMPIPLTVPLARLTAALAGTPPRLIPIPLVPRWITQHQDLRQRHWPGLELFQRLMKMLGPSAAPDG